MAAVDYFLANDGLPARPSGQWAEDKLHYVGRYMFAFSRGMKNRWRERVFLDLLAGPGRCRVKETGDEFDGSPLRAVNCAEPFSRVILVEQDPVLCDALRRRVGNQATVIQEDCNNDATIERLRQTIPTHALGLAFVDNLGLDVPFFTIKELTRGRRIDLLITFQIGDLTRNLKGVLEGRDSPDRWTAFFGGPGWKDIAERALLRNKSASAIATRLMRFYGQQLTVIGYPCIGHSHQTMKNRQNVTLYRLLLASRHQKAVELFEKVSQINAGGQRRFRF